MSFSRAQQPAWQAMIKRAWAAHCLAEGINPVPPKWDRDWYEQELYYAVKTTSTSDCNAGRDYDLAMAHFESIAGESIKWQMRVHSGDARRLLHELSEITEDHGIDEDYLRGVARQMLKVDHLPELSKLTKPQLVLILGEVKRHVRRNLKSEVSSTSSPEEFGSISSTTFDPEDIPF